MGDFVLGGVEFDLDMGAGDDWAMFLNGIAAGSYFPETPSVDFVNCTLSSCDDLLYFRNEFVPPISLDSGRDFVLADSNRESFEITDYDQAEDMLVVIP